MFLLVFHLLLFLFVVLLVLVVLVFVLPGPQSSFLFKRSYPLKMICLVVNKLARFHLRATRYPGQRNRPGCMGREWGSGGAVSEGGVRRRLIVNRKGLRAGTNKRRQERVASDVSRRVVCASKKST